MLRQILLSTVLLFTLFTAEAQQQEGSLVKWMKLQDALNASKTQQKPILLDFYTDWCGWCKRMMATTYSDPGLANYINQYYYPVKFNAEGHDTIVYEGRTYINSDSTPRSTHPLAKELLQGKLMYPTTLFMNAYDPKKDAFQIKMLAPGYLEKKQIEPILVFTLENVYRNSNLDDFSKAFETAFYDSTLSKRLENIKWMKPEVVFDGNFNNGKKTVVFLHTDWCNSCKVMERAVFSDTSISKLFTDKFNLVDFNPESDKPLFWNNKVFQKTPGASFPFHPLSLEFTRNNFILPSTVVLDEKGQVLDAIPFFLTATVLADILSFYGEDIYKNKSWADYQKGKSGSK